MKLLLVLIAAFISLASANAARAQTIPHEIWGKWVVRRILPTDTISCWGDAQPKTLLHTEIEYLPEVFRWKDVVTKHPVATSKVVTAQQFHDDNSGGAVDSSQVTFHQLGIKAGAAVEITIHHPPANITGATVEIPGDDVVLKDKDTIIFSACNIYFEAKRISAKTTGTQERRR
ncbi:MAG TPA: hypothetical protein VMF66_17640 [Candidatus Acidoferrum sp.]|nr:hypothetical protein [Candidatus Acidoferrum sp.]